MDNLALYTLVRQIVLTCTGVTTVIQANPNAPSPSGEYCTVFAKGPKRHRGQAIIRKTNTAPVTSPIGNVKEVQHDIRAQVIADVSVNFYRGNANDYAEQLFQSNKRPDIQELLFLNNAGWNGTNAINDLTALQSNSWESRAQITIRITYEQTTLVTTNAIYQLPVKVEDFDNNVIINDITIISPNP